MKKKGLKIASGKSWLVEDPTSIKTGTYIVIVNVNFKFTEKECH